MKQLLGIIGVLEHILGTLVEIRDELRKFNSTIPLVDELASRQEALREVEDQSVMRRRAATDAWSQFERKRITPRPNNRD